MRNLQNYNVLFLEDNRAFAKDTKNFLSLYFNEIYHSLSIEEALKMFHRYTLHLIISDIKVEDGNGLEFISKIREYDRQIPIIVLSAHKDEDFLFQAIQLNLTDYLIKPLNLNAFLQTMEKVEKIIHEVYETDINLGANLRYSKKQKTLISDDSVHPLTKKEILFLELLLRQNGQVVTKDHIQESVWENEPIAAAEKNGKRFDQNDPQRRIQFTDGLSF